MHCTCRKHHDIIPIYIYICHVELDSFFVAKSTTDRYCQTNICTWSASERIQGTLCYKIAVYNDLQFMEYKQNLIYSALI